MKNLTLIIFIALFSLIQCSPIESKQKKHPGCLIWWFAPDCPLAKMFGADPFNIYPWGKFCEKYSDFEGTKHCKKEKSAVEVQKEIITLPEDVELITNDDESNSKNAQEEESIKPNAVIKKSKRRSSGQNLEEICNNDSDFNIRHHGLCTTLLKMRRGKTMPIDVEEQNEKIIAKASIPNQFQIVASTEFKSYKH